MVDEPVAHQFEHGMGLAEVVERIGVQGHLIDLDQLRQRRRIDRVDSRQCPADVGDQVGACGPVVVVAQDLSGDRLALDRLEHHECGTVGLSLRGEEFGHRHARHTGRPHDIGLDEHVALIARPLTLDDRRPAVREEPPCLPRRASRQSVQVGDGSTVEHRRQGFTEGGGVHGRRITDRRPTNRIEQPGRQPAQARQSLTIRTSSALPCSISSSSTRCSRAPVKSRPP